MSDRKSAALACVCTVSDLDGLNQIYLKPGFGGGGVLEKLSTLDQC